MSATSPLPFLREIQELLAESIEHYTPLYGTNFVSAFKVETAKQGYFLKHTREKTQVFFKEAHGLREMKETETIDVVGVIKATEHFLLLDFIESPRLKGNFFSDFGGSLAEMHQSTSSRCGFFEDNFLGATPQPNLNPKNLSWPSFFWEKRLLYQCQLGVKNGLIENTLEKNILQLAPIVFDLLHTEEPPSLLHGDLWSGNYLVNSQGRACLIDPAVYYGHREAELAMASLFGGFPPEFYKGYNKSFPLEKGADKRLPLYQLYHLLNHLNLFGKSYLGSVEKVVQSYI